MVDRAVLTYRLGAAAVTHAPDAVVDPARRLVSRIASHALRGRRAMVARHLRRVVGCSLQGVALDRMIDATFDAYARYWIDSARIPLLSPAEVDSGFSYEGFEHIENGWAAGSGTILALPHVGGWEWAGRWLTCRPGYEVTVVVEPQRPPELFEWMIEYREAFGMEVVPLGPNVASRVVSALGANRIVCLLCDRDIEGNGIEVELFGEPTTIPAGPAALALRTGASLVPVAVYQTRSGHHAVVRPPLDTERRGRLRDDVAAVSQALAAELELLIRAHPEQWHLMAPNWPSDLVA